MRIALIQFPGSNCERETALALKRAGLEPVDFLWNQELRTLAHFAGYVLVGGFSYEDRSRSGIIAAMDPLMSILSEEGAKGKPILGICNGAQILVESGLVPGLKGNQLGLALTENKQFSSGKLMGTGFYNAWVHMRLNKHYQKGAFTRHLKPDSIIHLPVAHGEGRFLIPPALLQEMQAQGMGLFQYCSANGEVQDEFPINPNGSIDNLAAITNQTGNIMAMMPHPERTTQGDAIFLSMRDYLQEGRYQAASALNYQAPMLQLQTYQAKTRELLVELLITDNQAVSVNQTPLCSQLGLELKRQTHWEIDCESPEVYEKILETEVIFNRRKESCVDLNLSSLPQGKALLVRAKDDLLGLEKKQMLETHFGIRGIQAIRHGVLWRIPAREDQDLITDRLIHSHLLFNPYAHDCYYYT